MFRFSNIHAAVLCTLLVVVTCALIFAARRSSSVHSFPLRPVTTADHQLGASGARIVVIEYSDTECPFCKELHQIELPLRSQYKKTVLWVYRHFPIDDVHPKAREEAQAAECAGFLGGESTFWKYIDRLYEETNSNNTFNLSELSTLASSFGLNMTQFSACLSSNHFAQKVQNDISNALDLGLDKTPALIILFGSSSPIVITGSGEPLPGILTELHKRL